MSTAAEMLLERARAAADDGDAALAASFAEAALQEGPDEQQSINAWLLLSRVSERVEDKRKYLEYALGLEPWNPEVHRGLAMLRGDLKPDDVIDPDHLQPRAPTQERVNAKPRVCSRCGGRMTFDPVSQALVCAYCGYSTATPVADTQGELDERDFAVALATAKGHSQPVTTHTFECRGCGAAFVLAPGILSANCPYCQSAYVLEAPTTRELLPPDGVIGFATTQETAHKALRGWLATKKFAATSQPLPPAGVYLPAWTFDVGGEVRWTGYQADYQGSRRWQRVPVSGRYPVLYNDLLVPASDTLPADLLAEIDGFDLSALQPYVDEYLAGWPAEIYRVTVSDASLVARQKAWEDASERVRLDGSITSDVDDLAMSSAGIAVTSFKLILLPFWVGHYTCRGKTFSAVVNGQTAAVRAQAPRGALRRLFGRLVGGG